MLSLTSTRLRSLTLASLLASTAVLASACGDDADASGTITVHAKDFEFEDLPDKVAPGTVFELVNDAPTELHELVALRLPDDESRPVDEIVHGDLGSLFAGPPAFVLLAPPGGDQVVAVGDGTLTEPGRYLVLCMIPTGVDPAEYLAAAAQASDGPPQIENAGPPHVAHGMYAELTVG